MKQCVKKFLNNEEGNNLVIALILLGIIALPLVIWLGGLADGARDRAAEEGDAVFERDAGEAYEAPGAGFHASVPVSITFI